MTHVHDRPHAGPVPPAVLEVAFGNCHDASEYAGLEVKLNMLPGVLSVHIDRTRGVAHLGFDTATVSADDLRVRLHAAGYICDCENCKPSAVQPGHPGQQAAGTQAMLSGAGHGHQASLSAESHADHSDMDHDEHAGHGEAMANDMLRRFLISLLLTLPIILFSPIGAGLGFRVSPPFGLSMAWFGLILSTPVVWWGGWPFLSAAWRALLQRQANMMTLISTGILTSA